MQKKLTVLVAFAVFVLIVGWAITPAQAHTKFCDTKPDHHHCPNGEPPPDDDGNVVSAITFTVTGDLNLIDEDGVIGEVCQADVSIKSGTHVLSTSMRLTFDFFHDKFGDDGENCFTENSYFAFFQFGKIGGIDPNVSFYPNALTSDGENDPVGYQLWLTSSDGPLFEVPPDEGSTLIDFDGWEILARGTNSNRACTGEGALSSVIVTVTRDDKNECPPLE